MQVANEIKKINSPTYLLYQWTPTRQACKDIPKGSILALISWRSLVTVYVELRPTQQEGTIPGTKNPRPSIRFSEVMFLRWEPIITAFLT